MIIYFIPEVLIFIFIAVIIGGGYAILSNLSTILLHLHLLFMICLGIYHIVTLFRKETVLGKIARFLRGILCFTIVTYIAALIRIGKGTYKFDYAKFPLFELLHIRKLNENFTILILTLLIIFIVLILSLIGKMLSGEHKYLAAVCYIADIIMIVFIYIAGCKIAMNDFRQNSYDSFDFQMEKYEVLEDTNVYIKFESLIGFKKLLKVGTLDKESRVYANGEYIKIDGIEYDQISDGNKLCGFVSSECLKSLYEIAYILNTDAVLYTFETVGDGRAYSTASGGVSVSRKDFMKEEVIGTVPAGTEVYKEGTVYSDSSDTEGKYCKIVLSDGTEGCVQKEFVEEVRQLN